MITDNDLQISNKSYINKDFPVIYQELVDLAKKLSYKFDPETSNESDPFVVIVKLLAFMGDKTNYNNDKNVLERFMPSATQESSMRELCAMMGYNVKYYIAPTTTVTFKYTGNKLESGDSFTLKGLETILTDASNEVSYVTTRDVSLYSNNVSASVPVIQGVVKTLVTLNGEIVKLENLDDNLRIYFPEKMVAQNGIFIEGGNLSIEDEWTFVDNLNVIPPKSFVYTFGYDSFRGLPYLQFPTDISSLIGSGLTIKYVLTSGLDGNIKAKVLTNLNSPTTITSENGNTITLVSTDESFISITNINATINGDNPESIDRAYINFKKTVGTFDTLITCRDYMNYIYKMLDDEGVYPLVSNVLVADRRTDYNFANNIITFNDFGQTSINKPIGDITAYDLLLYPMNPIKTYDTDAYNYSFQPLENKNKIINKLEDSKCLSHNYYNMNAHPENVFAFKNYYRLDVKLSTTYKVNSIEGKDIVDNVVTALIENFNGREVDFGYEIPYDSILKVIEQADKRIKSAVLSDPDLVAYVMTVSGGEVVLGYSNDTVDSTYLKLLAKNVLAGKVELFNYNELFDYDFGQKQRSGLTMLNKGVSYLTTNANITLKENTSGEALSKNEVVQFIMPSLITDITYPYGIGYVLVLANVTDILKADEEYELQSGECCVFIYRDTSNNQVVDIYTQGQIVKPNVDLRTTEYRIETLSQTPRVVTVEGTARTELEQLGLDIIDSNGNVQEFVLNTNEQIEHRVLNEEEINTNCYLYWIVNNDENRITFNADNEYMIEDGEYLFRTDASFNELYSYGSGTVIKLTNLDTSAVAWTTPKVELEDISENGILGIKDKFVFKSLNGNSYITMKEQTIYTGIEGDVIKYINTNTPTVTLTNDFQDIDTSSKIIIGDVALPQLSFTENYIKARNRLDIDAGPVLSQTLKNNQTVKIENDSQTVLETLVAGDTFNLSTFKQLGGGNHIDIRTVNYLVDKDAEDRIIKNDVYAYVVNNVLDRNNTNYSTVTLTYTDNKKELVVPVFTNEDVFVMVYSDSDNVLINTDASSVDITVPMSQSDWENHIMSVADWEDTIIEATTYGVIDYSTNTVVSQLKKGINILQLHNIGSIEFELDTSDTDETANLIISKPRVVDMEDGGYGYNKAFKLSSTQEPILRTIIQGFDTDEDFYYTNYVDNVKTIDTDDFTDPYVLFDYNNIANKNTISEIDFKNSNISIVRSSLV